MPVPFPDFLHGRRPAAFALAFLLTGCAGMSAPLKSPAGTTSAQSASPLVYSDAIDLGGRLSVHYQKNGQDEALHGNFLWAQTPGHILVTLLSPLGQTIARIDVTPGVAILSQAGREPRAASDVDALAAETLGWPLPVSGLRQWLQGFATDADGRQVAATPQSAQPITTLDGWRIRYASWQEDGSHPKRIDLERSTAEAGDVSIRLVIDTWQPH